MRTIMCLIIIFTLFCTVRNASAEVIDVLIKGFDDGVKTNKQQDYKEAVMNAKLQAIERAGVEIESITRIVNFQMKFKQVETKARAALMPGFNILDIGYSEDGYYKIVLEGKVKLLEDGESNQTEGNLNRFIIYNNLCVLDKKTGLMWSAKDFVNIESKAPINWDEAVSWVRQMNQNEYGGYGDWRIPTIDEYKGIYILKQEQWSYNHQPVSYSKSFEGGGGVWFWSNDHKGSWAKVFSFHNKEIITTSKDSPSENPSIRLVRYFK